MKNEKFCFNKRIGLITLVGVLLVGFALVNQIFTGTKTSTNSRAYEIGNSEIKQKQTKNQCSYEQPCVYTAVTTAAENYHIRDLTESKRVCIKNTFSSECTTQLLSWEMPNPTCHPSNRSETQAEKNKRCTISGLSNNINFFLEAKTSNDIQSNYYKKYENLNQETISDTFETEINTINVDKIDMSNPYKLDVLMGTNLYGYKKVIVIIDCDANLSGTFKDNPVLNPAYRDSFFNDAKSFEPYTSFNRVRAELVFNGVDELVEPKKVRNNTSIIPWAYGSGANGNPMICEYRTPGKHLIYAQATVETEEFDSSGVKGSKIYSSVIPMYINIQKRLDE